MLFVSLWGGGGGVQELKPLEGLIGLRRVWDSRFRIVGILGLDWGWGLVSKMWVFRACFLLLLHEVPANPKPQPPSPDTDILSIIMYFNILRYTVVYDNASES